VMIAAQVTPMTMDNYIPMVQKKWTLTSAALTCQVRKVGMGMGLGLMGLA
jgi:hypothetical protein